MLLDAWDDASFTGVMASHGWLEALGGGATDQQRLALEARAVLLPALLARARRMLESMLGRRAARAVGRRRARREAVLQLPLPLPL
jgi:hypothetical protein